VKSHITERFARLFSQLPPEAQQQARAAYRLFLQNPRHPSLHFKQVSAAHPEYHSARVGAHYRALGILDDDTVTWFWIGSHEDYNNLTKRL
jgi:hypothetical protein